MSPLSVAAVMLSPVSRAQRTCLSLSWITRTATGECDATTGTCGVDFRLSTVAEHHHRHHRLHRHHHHMLYQKNAHNIKERKTHKTVNLYTTESEYGLLVTVIAIIQTNLPLTPYFVIRM